MITKECANEISELMTQPDIFPEARKEFSRTLFDYYKELLYRDPVPPIPTPRRMW